MLTIYFFPITGLSEVQDLDSRGGKFPEEFATLYCQTNPRRSNADAQQPGT